MPTQWTLVLSAPVDLSTDARYDILHAIACAFFAEVDTQHAAAEKPFAVRHLGQPEKCTGVMLTWLPDTAPPATAIPTALRLGVHTVEVANAHMRRSRLVHLPPASDGRRLRFSVITPAHFRHHGTDRPLPDPFLTFGGLGRRFQAVAAIDTTDDLVRDVARAAVIYEHDIHTEHFSWHGTSGAGFVGTVIFGLPRTAPPAARKLFDQLGAFAAIAGIGHGTTHGLGAVDIAAPPA